MTKAEFLQQTYDLLLQSGMNQRYQQLYAARWWLTDSATKVGTAVAAVAGGLLAIATAVPQANDSLDAVS